MIYLSDKPFTGQQYPEHTEHSNADTGRGVNRAPLRRSTFNTCEFYFEANRYYLLVCICYSLLFALVKEQTSYEEWNGHRRQNRTMHDRHDIMWLRKTCWLH